MSVTKDTITFFKTGPGEGDGVGVETLLMKLALAETVIKDMKRYISATEAHDGVRPDYVEEPDEWAIIGMDQSLAEIAHALKCGGWGFQAAHLH